MSVVVRRCALPVAVALLLLGSAACGSDSESTAATGLRQPSVDSSDTRAHRLMDLVERTDTLSTLTRALRQAGLAEELQTGGPYTLFAPTNRAFQQDWPGFDSLLAPAGTSAVGAPGQEAARPRSKGSTHERDSLRQVLAFHLVHGRFTAAGIKDSLRLGTLMNQSLLLQRAPNDSRRLRLLVEGTPGPIPIRRTIEAQNGVIHVVPRPLRIPPPDTSRHGALRRSDTTGTSASDDS